MFVTNWISTTKIQKISEITNFFRHYFLSRTEVKYIKRQDVLQRFHQYNEERGNQAFSDTYWYYFDKAEVPKLNIN